MSRVSTILVASILAAAVAPAQEMPKNAPHFVHSVKAPGIDVRFLDFKWDPVVFETLEKGGSAPAGRRSWVLARMLLTTDPMRWEGKLLPVGPSLLVLNPAKGSAGPTLDIRYIDLREVFRDLNVIAEPPPTEIYKTMPVVFEKAESTAPLFDLTLKAKGKSYEMGSTTAIGRHGHPQPLSAAGTGSASPVSRALRARIRGQEGGAVSLAGHRPRGGAASRRPLAVPGSGRCREGRDSPWRHRGHAAAVRELSLVAQPGDGRALGRGAGRGPLPRASAARGCALPLRPRGQPLGARLREPSARHADSTLESQVAGLGLWNSIPATLLSRPCSTQAASGLFRRHRPATGSVATRPRRLRLPSRFSTSRASSARLRRASAPWPGPG